MIGTTHALSVPIFGNNDILISVCASLSRQPCLSILCPDSAMPLYRCVVDLSVCLMRHRHANAYSTMWVSSIRDDASCEHTLSSRLLPTSHPTEVSATLWFTEILDPCSEYPSEKILQATI